MSTIMRQAHWTMEYVKLRLEADPKLAPVYNKNMRLVALSNGNEKDKNATPPKNDGRK